MDTLTTAKRIFHAIQTRRTGIYSGTEWIDQQVELDVDDIKKRYEELRSISFTEAGTTSQVEFIERAIKEMLENQ